MNLIIELKRNRQPKVKEEPIIHTWESLQLQKKEGKITHVPIKKGQHQRHVTTKPCKKHTQQSCAWKTYFLKIIIYKNCNNHSINGVL